MLKCLIRHELVEASLEVRGGGPLAVIDLRTDCRRGGKELGGRL